MSPCNGCVCRMLSSNHMFTVFLLLCFHVLYVPKPEPERKREASCGAAPPGCAVGQMCPSGIKSGSPGLTFEKMKQERELSQWKTTEMHCGKNYNHKGLYSTDQIRLKIRKKASTIE